MIKPILKYVFCLILTACINNGFAQSTDLNLHYTKKDIDIDHNLTTDPASLSAALTKNKSSDKEKFDAIFAWVASNISYDLGIYYSPSGVGTTHVKLLLKRRKGICADYATLMDTLCTFAGLTNVSVYGYAKDEIFDVNDSLYIDNHAWNAIRLDGLWYLYDVTWASGEVEYHYTKFSRFILKLMGKFPDQYKRKMLQQRRKWFSRNECGNNSQEPLYYYKPKKFNRFMRRFLGLFRLVVRQKFTQKLNTDFYRAEPEIFAITHLPDNVAWSLLNDKTMRSFEKDSLFYHLSDSTYRWQGRGGQPCPRCEYDLSMDELGRMHYLREESFLLNPRNRFITSVCEYKIAMIHNGRSDSLYDSLSVIRQLDTSLAYLQHARASLKQCFINNSVDYNLQKKKNRYKQTLLLKDNRLHTAFVRSKVNTTLTRRRALSSVQSRCAALLNKYDQRSRRISQLTDVAVINKRVSREKTERLTIKMEVREREIDSLNNMISADKIRLDSISSQVSVSVWQKVLRHDSLITPVMESIHYRKLLKDNFKKPVVEVRKQIPLYEEKYARGIDSAVYSPAKSLTGLITQLVKLIDKRNNYETDLHRLKLLLVKSNVVPVAGLAQYKAGLIKENREDYCWFRSKLPVLGVSMQGFEALGNEQNKALAVIITENAVERYRAVIVNKELLRRKRKYKNMTAHNNHVTVAELHLVKKKKHDYLKALETKRQQKSSKS